MCPSNDPSNHDGQKPKKSAWAYLHVGLEFGAIMALCVYGGFWLDQRFGLQPLGVCLGALVGLTTAMYHLLKETA
jgi:F0F1-type ATP synthase assembly protein I